MARAASGLGGFAQHSESRVGLRETATRSHGVFQVTEPEFKFTSKPEVGRRWHPSLGPGPDPDSEARGPLTTVPVPVTQNFKLQCGRSNDSDVGSSHDGIIMMQVRVTRTVQGYACRTP